MPCGSFAGAEFHKISGQCAGSCCLGILLQTEIAGRRLPCLSAIHFWPFEGDRQDLADCRFINMSNQVLHLLLELQTDLNLCLVLAAG